MAKNNSISAIISAEAKQAVLQGLASAETNLQPVLLFNLTPAERLSLVKMGDKTFSFVHKALGFAAHNPELIPAYLDVPEALKDLELATQLAEIHRRLSQLLTAVEDTMMVAGSEAYESALIFYNAVKGASRSNIPGTEAIHGELSNHFPRRRSERAEPLQPA
jgi:hypothetical protein